MPEKLESLSPPCLPRGWVSPLSWFDQHLCGVQGVKDGLFCKE